jgi:glycogen synthase
MNVIDKIYDKLSVKEKFEVCKEIISSDMTVEETDKEIDKIKSTLNSYEKQVFSNYFHNYVWEKYKKLNKAFLKEIVWKNYYIIQASKQNRKVLIVYLVSNKHFFDEDFKTLPDFIESDDESTTYQEQMVREKNIFNLFSSENKKEFIELKNNLFKIEEDSRNEIKLIIKTLNKWNDAYRQFNSKELVNEAIKLIDDFTKINF